MIIKFLMVEIIIGLTSQIRDLLTLYSLFNNSIHQLILFYFYHNF